MLEIIGVLLNSPDNINILGCSYIYLTKKKMHGRIQRGGGGGGGGGWTRDPDPL